MSFDLYIFPPSGPTTTDQVHRLMQVEEKRIVGGSDDALPPPSLEMARFLTELERGWPVLEDDPEDRSPWSSWPLWQPMTGGGTGLNIRWSRANSMLTAILEIAARTNVIVYDPQANQVILPPGHAVEDHSS